jgi:glycosyltransferase involved in cell wall biosynthesis
VRSSGSIEQPKEAVAGLAEPAGSENGPEQGVVPSLAERRILVLAPQPFYEDRGTPIALRQVLEALGELNYRVDLVTFPVGADVTIPGLSIFRVANPLGIRNVPVGFSIAKLLLDVSLISSLRRRLRLQTYTCIHAVEEAAFPAAVLGRSYGVPVLYDMQSSLPEQMTQRRVFRFPPVRAFLHYMERWLLNRVDLVVSSAGLAERVHRLAPAVPVREWRFPSTPIEASPRQVEALRRQLELPPGATVVLYSGTFEAYQGLSELLAAIPAVRSRVPEATFVLVGADQANGLASSETAQTLMQAGALRIVERQPRPEMAAYLMLADVLVSPRSYGGNLPLKVFDYLAAGRPIVATDIPTHRTVLNDERAVLVAPQTEAIATGILGLLLDRDRALRLSGAARSYAREHLGWGSFTHRVAELYEEVHRRAAVARQ